MVTSLTSSPVVIISLDIEHACLCLSPPLVSMGLGISHQSYLQTQTSLIEGGSPSGTSYTNNGNSSNINNNSNINNSSNISSSQVVGLGSGNVKSVEVCHVPPSLLLSNKHALLTPVINTNPRYTLSPPLCSSAFPPLPLPLTPPPLPLHRYQGQLELLLMPSRRLDRNGPILVDFDRQVFTLPSTPTPYPYLHHLSS